MRTSTRPEPQPIATELRRRRYPQAELARRTGFSSTWVSRVVNGYEEPSRRFRAACTLALGKPDHELFRPEPSRSEAS